jgi:hypothetical protein
MSSLIDALKEIPDPRKARGKSHPLWILLLLIIMGTIAGYQGYRPLETFVQEHYEPLCRSLGIEFKRPSYSTYRRIMMTVSFDDLSECFEQWMNSHSATVLPDNRVSGLDGKRIRQTLRDAKGKDRFVGLVSLFGLEQGVTLKVQALTETDHSEIKVVETLLETLQVSGLVISMDALHTPKNLKACA